MRVGVAALHFEHRAPCAQKGLYLGARLPQLVHGGGGLLRRVPRSLGAAARRLVLRASQVNKLPVAESGGHSVVVSSQVYHVVVSSGGLVSSHERSQRAAAPLRGPAAAATGVQLRCVRACTLQQRLHVSALQRLGRHRIHARRNALRMLLPQHVGREGHDGQPHRRRERVFGALQLPLPERGGSGASASRRFLLDVGGRLQGAASATANTASSGESNRRPAR